MSVPKRLTRVAGFPHLITLRKLIPLPVLPGQIYSRTLFSSGNGSPMWQTGIGSEMPSPYEDRPICIGDVGILSDADCCFYFAFNIFLPADDPLNGVLEDGELPEGFAPLEPLDDSEITITPGYFPPGSTIVSKGVQVSRLAEDPLHLEFRSWEPEAALLVLPDGASREDMSTTRLNEYIEKHALNWARYFEIWNHPLYAEVNGGVYVITGQDRAKSCSMAAFPSQTNRRTQCMYAEFTDGQLQYNDDTNSKNIISSSDNANEEECVFLRGVRISLNGETWTACFPPPPEGFTPVSVLPTNATRPKTSGTRATHNMLLLAPTSLRHHPFHPSDIISQIMFFHYPQARLVLVHDQIWSSITDGKNELKTPLIFTATENGFSNGFSALIKNVVKSHKIVEKNGVITLIRMGNIHRIPWLVRGLKTVWSKRPKCIGGTNNEDFLADLIHQGEAALPNDEYRIMY